MPPQSDAGGLDVSATHLLPAAPNPINSLCSPMCKVLTVNGIAKLVEYNIRFGDPECQVLMLRMKSDLVEMMLNSIAGTIKSTNLEWDDDHCATVVMASNGYPGKFEKKTIIKNLEELKAKPQP